MTPLDHAITYVTAVEQHDAQDPALAAHAVEILRALRTTIAERNALRDRVCRLEADLRHHEDAIASRLLRGVG